jgi:hypothetical protein
MEVVREARRNVQMAIDIRKLQGLDEAAKALARLNEGLGSSLTKTVLEGVGQHAASMQKALAAPALTAAAKAQESIAKSVMQAARPAIADAFSVKVSTAFGKLAEDSLAKIGQSFSVDALPSLQVSSKLMESIKNSYPQIDPKRYKLDMSPVIRAQAEERAAIVSTPSLLEDILEVAISEREDARADREAAAADRAVAAVDRRTSRRRSWLALALAALAVVPYLDNIWAAIQLSADWLYRLLAG